MESLDQKVWDYWKRQPRAQRPSRESLQAAMQFFGTVLKEDARSWPECYQLAEYLDALKQTWTAHAPPSLAPDAPTVAQAPWTYVCLENLMPEIRQQQFGQSTPPFQTVQESARYLAGVSAADPFRTTIQDVASYAGVAGSAVERWICMGQRPYVSAANFATITYEIGMPNGTPTFHPKVHISFNGPKFRGWKGMPQKVQQHFEPGPTRHQADVYLFVRSLEGPPGRKGADKRFYIAACQKWNEKYLDRSMTWQSLQREYNEAKKICSHWRVPLDQ
jgi:hypothetical protein